MIYSKRIIFILISWKVTRQRCQGNDALIEAVKENAGTVKDYRHQSYIRHPLVSIIMIVFFAVLANADEWAEIETFAKKKEKWLREHLDLPHGIPTDDTYRIVMGNIDTEHFFRLTVKLLIEAVDDLLAYAGGETYGKSITSVDGKVSRGSARKESAGQRCQTRYLQHRKSCG